MEEVVAQVLEVRWRPDLSYFDRNIEIMRQLEKADLLAAFKVTGTHTNAMLGPGLSIGLSAQGLMAANWLGTGRHQIAEALQMVITDLQPRGEILYTRFSAKSILPLAGDYLDLRVRGGQHIGGELPGTVFGDWSVLVDGANDNLGAFFKVEYGLIEQSEVRGRLSGAVGRLDHVEIPGLAPEELFTEVGELPGLAFFADWHWHRQGGQDASDLPALLSFWDSVVKETLDISGMLVKNTVGESDRNP